MLCFRRYARLVRCFVVCCSVSRSLEVLVDFANGGLGGFLYNLSPESGSEWLDLRSTIDSIKSYGRPQIARALEDALEIVERAGPRGTTWGAFISARDPEDQLDAIDRELSNCHADLWDDIERAALALPE